MSVNVPTPKAPFAHDEDWRDQIGTHINQAAGYSRKLGRNVGRAYERKWDKGGTSGGWSGFSLQGVGFAAAVVVGTLVSPATGSPTDATFGGDVTAQTKLLTTQDGAQDKRSAHSSRGRRSAHATRRG